MEKRMKVFLLEHLHLHRDGSEDVKTIGIYSTRAVAVAATKRLAKQPGFRKYPKIRNPLVEDYASGFYINEYTINQDNWAEGFVKG